MPTSAAVFSGLAMAASSISQPPILEPTSIYKMAKTPQIKYSSTDSWEKKQNPQNKQKKQNKLGYLTSNIFKKPHIHAVEWLKTKAVV